MGGIVLGNQYALGEDALNTPGRVRYHSGDSIQIKYYDNKERFMDKAAFSLTATWDASTVGGVSCAGNSTKGPKQSFLATCLQPLCWFDNDKYGLTLGGGQINNPGGIWFCSPIMARRALGTP